MGGKKGTTAGCAAAVKNSADPERAQHFFKLLEATSADLSRLDPESARILAALFSGSNALGAVLVAHPEWLSLLSPETVKFPRRKEGLLGELTTTLAPTLQRREFEPALNQLRLFKQR